MSSLAAGPTIETLRRTRRAPTRPRAVPPPATKHLLLMVNPRSTSLEPGDRERVARSLDSAFSVTTIETEARGHAKAIGREAAQQGYDVVAVLGGDGTVSEAADGLAGSPTSLACLPAGLTNVFARTVGTPTTAPLAAERLAARAERFEPRAVDLGTVNGRHFTFTSGVGLSGSLVGAADAAPERKAKLGQLHYVATAASLLARRYLRDPPRIRVEADGRQADGITLVVQNSDPLSFFGSREIRVCEQAGLDTGSISLTLLKHVRARDLTSILPRLLSGRAEAVVGHRNIEGFAAIDSARVSSPDGVPLPIEADGEFVGEAAEIEYGSAPGALRIVS